MINAAIIARRITVLNNVVQGVITMGKLKSALEILQSAGVQISLNLGSAMCQNSKHCHKFGVDIEDYVQDKTFQKEMEKAVSVEKSRDRIEKRTAFATSDTEWLQGREGWEGLKCIGAVRTEFEAKGKNQANGIIIFPAADCQRMSCFTMHAGNGRWKQCTGCLMYISGKITAVWKTETCSRT